MRLSMTRNLVDAQHSVRRFPLVILCTLVAAYAAIEWIDNTSDPGPFIQLLMASVLGIPFLLTLALAFENQKMHPWLGRLARVGGLLALVLYYLLLPEELPQSHVIRFFILLFAWHFLVSVAPFLRQNPGQALWQFNKTLLLRFTSSLLFTFVLYAGLSLALAALDQLLGVSLPSDSYVKLFFLLGFVFNTWFFLGGIPENPLGLADDDDFPRALRVFAQHILSTLVVIYLAILLAYLGKVMLTGVWPSGWIGWLVSSVAVAGLLSVVLLSPLQGQEGDRWVRIYFRIFHILMLPSVVMLVLAVSKRLNQYGLTELRYILVVLSGWLAVILVLGLVSKRISIRTIPLSLGVLGLLMSLGPWSAVSMSLHSQKGRLVEELTEIHLYSEGQFVPAKIVAKSVAHSDILHSIKYLMDQFGHEEIDQWLTPEMHEAMYSVQGDGQLKYSNNRERIDLIADELRIPRIWQSSTNIFQRHSLLGDGRFNAVSIGDFDYSLVLETLPGNFANFKWGDVEAKVGLTPDGGDLIVKKSEQIVLRMPLRELFQDLAKTGEGSNNGHEGTVEEMTFNYANENLKVRLIIHRVVFQGSSEQPLVQTLKGQLLLGDVAK